MPLELFFSKPHREHFRLSPNGRSVSCLAALNGRMNLQVQALQDSSRRFLTAFNDRDLAFQLWKTDEILIFAKDVHGDEMYHLFSVRADGSDLKDLTPFDGCRATLLDELPADPEHVLITLSLAHETCADVYRLNIRSGSLEKMAENNGRIVDWLADHAGRVRIAVEKRGARTALLHRSSQDSEFHAILELDLDVTVRPLLFTFDNASLYAASNMGRDKLALVVLDLQRGTERETLFEHPEFDVQALSHSWKRKCITQVSFLGWKTVHHFFDEWSNRLHQAWAGRFGEDEIEIVDMSTDEQVVLLQTSSDVAPRRYHVARGTLVDPVELDGAGPRPLEERLSAMKPVTVTARDGLPLHGYLTLPAADGAPFPVVLKVHGGPWQRDRWRYDPEVQFLASRGYAVLQLNFRGSTGYGRNFWKASFREWGRRMQDDLSDGVKWLVGQGLAEPRRIAIYGVSYGGYAALAGLALTPDLYACGVAVSAPTDLRRLVEKLPPRWQAFGPSLREMIGDPMQDRAALEAVSPAKRLESIKAPLLLAHGKLDPRVSHEDLLSLAEALRNRGNPVQCLLFEDEGHWINGGENRMRFARALEAFLSTHLRPSSPATNANGGSFGY
jgi:dipeptidyl aminopeptidase/acylaminoacyl peptidase